jgi:adenylate cyclase
MPARAQIAIIVRFMLISIVVSAIFGQLEAVSLRATGNEGYLRGGVTGALICGVLATLETTFNRPWAAPLRQSPFLVLLAARSLVYVCVILLGFVAGYWLAPIPGETGFAVHRAEVLLSIALSIGFNLLMGVNHLLGQRVLFNFVAGRYHRPRLETRVLLFIDMEASTAIAERLGELRFLDLLNRFVSDLSVAIGAEGGEIHKYVGDEVIATWRRDADPSRAVRACFAARTRLAARAGDYERDFGLRADFRAGLHSGPVVIGELGLLKMEIALIGDTMNTTSRIQQACRDTGYRVLASAALIDRLVTLPAGIAKRALGALTLRGKGSPLELYALDAVPLSAMPDARSAAAG